MIKLLTYFFPNKFYKPVYKLIDAEHNVNNEHCSLCKGRCCKKAGCHFSPDDFGKITYRKLKKIIDKGYIRIEFIPKKYLSLNDGVFILRIRNVDEPVVGKFRKTGCMFLTENGCKLDYNHRPTGGKLLIPIIDYEGIGRCYNMYSVDDCCKEWYTFRRIIRKLVKHYKK